MLRLPSFWVYVEFENGHRENVANTDSLSKERADGLMKQWNDSRCGKDNGRVVKVSLESSDGSVYKTYRY